jgi:hypothetical protein
MNSENLSVERSALNVERLAPAPVLRIQALATRALSAFPECGLSWGLIRDWALEQCGLQRRWAGDVRAIDDEMERVAPLLAECLQNDPPAKRRAIWLAWKETHARTELRAREISPPVA